MADKYDPSMWNGNTDSFPRISIELQGVQYHVIHAFGEAMDDIKEYATEAITASMNALRMDGLKTAIVKSVEKTMDEVIDKSINHAVQEAVDRYFYEGAGKDFIADAIVEYLKKQK